MTDRYNSDGRGIGLKQRFVDVGDDAYARHVAVTLVDENGDVLAALTTSGGLTDTQLRASAVPVEEHSWEPTVVSDVTNADSDKTLTVPTSTEWQLLALYVTLAASDDVGDRQLAILITDASDNVLAQVRPNAVQGVGVTRHYSIALGHPDDTAFYDTDLLRTPLPVMTLPEGYKVRVYDNNAVAAAADNLHIQLSVMAR